MGIKSPRSDKYQYRYSEIPVIDLVMYEANLQVQEKLSDDFMDLRDALLDRLMCLAERDLSDTNYEIISLTLCGYTQVEIAKVLKHTQGSITAALTGRRGQSGHGQYKSIYERLQIAASNDPVTYWILKGMEAELNK